MKSLKDKYVLIIGSSNMDLNIYSQRLPKPGETVTGGKFKQFLGGKGANQAVAAVRSGANTKFIGKIGKDAFGDQMMAQLTKEGIDMAHMLRDSQEPSGVAFIMIDEKGENMISVAPGANFKLTPEEVRKESELIRNASVIVVQMEIPIETISEIFTIATKGNAVKILNPAPLKPIPIDLIKKIDVIIPNEGELFRLRELLGFKDIEGEGKEKIITACRDVVKFGAKTVITTLGSKGCLLFDKNQVIEVPALKVTAIDTVGAGDCFNGVVASKLSQGEPLLSAVQYAIVAAAIKVTRKGAQAGMPYKQEIEEKFKELQKFLTK